MEKLSQEDLDDAFITAVRKDSLSGVKRLLENMGASIDAKDNAEFTGLMYAVLRNNMEMAKFLAGEGCNIHAVDNMGHTALHLAAQGKSPEMTKALLDWEADINTQSFAGQTAVYFATADAPTLKIFLEAGADISLPDIEGRTPLLLAVRHSREDAVELLLAKKPDLEVKDQGGCTALAHAVMNRSYTIIRRLAEAGANLDPVDLLGRTPSQMTPSIEIKSLIKILKEERLEKELSIFKNGLPYPVKATQPFKFKRGP